MKTMLKKAVQTAVAMIAPQMWKLRPTSLLVMMYHRVLPNNHPNIATEQPGMYVSPETLRMHLEVLKENFTLVHLEDWLADASAGRKLPRRACAITFDDGWRDNYDYAFPILKRAAAPATIYLVSNFVGTRYVFWPNMLARLLASGDGSRWSRLPPWLRTILPQANAKMTSTEIDEIISLCKQYSDSEMLTALNGIFDHSTGDRDLMNWSEIDEMQASGLIKFGSHTRRHTRLPLIKASEELEDEILGSREEIGQYIRVAPTTFCYPNGDTSNEAVKIVRKEYAGAVTTQAGWNSRSTDRFLLRRIGVHEDVSRTSVSFISRLAGIG